MILIFEGPDTSGKDTLIKLLHKKTNYKHQTINRFTASTFVYGLLFNRVINQAEIFRIDKLFNKTFKPLYVYVYYDIVFSKKRFSKRPDDFINYKQYRDLRKYYDYYYKICYYDNKIRINTGRKTARECIKLIVDKIKEIEMGEKNEN